MSNLSFQSNSFKLNIPDFRNSSVSKTVNSFNRNSLTDLSTIAIRALNSVQFSNNLDQEQPRIIARSDSIDSDNMSTSSKERSVSPIGRQTQVIFVHKLYNMLNDENLQDYICWSPEQDSFYVFHGEEFNKNILACFFKHTNMSSFIRQLNMYGFHKVNEAAKEKTESDLVSSLFEKPTNRWEFRHSQNLFKKGDIESLNNIKRRSSKNNINNQNQKDIINLNSIAQPIIKNESQDEQVSPKQRQGDSSPDSSYFQPHHPSFSTTNYNVKLQSPMTPSSSLLSAPFQPYSLQQQPIHETINPQQQLPQPPQSKYSDQFSSKQQPSLEYVHTNSGFSYLQQQRSSSSSSFSETTGNNKRQIDYLFEEISTLKKANTELHQMYQTQQNLLINFLNLYEDNKLDSTTITNLKNSITSINYQQPQQQPQQNLPSDYLSRKNSSYSPLSTSRQNSINLNLLYNNRTNSLPLLSQEQSRKISIASNFDKLPSVDQLNMKIKNYPNVGGSDPKKRKL
ncbi:SFL1 [Candida pseudojiufengensis]|uniref:SFL1 n=1 Tax=Candida pseudojiufengensis TaxID=497109 RepID=UPI0022248501|nr:SFL1 [Candida pseudojiufengensis]KAI5962536.1 SFL1 [Candida pseudojiufengensis]